MEDTYVSLKRLVETVCFSELTILNVRDTATAE